MCPQKRTLCTIHITITGSRKTCHCELVFLLPSFANYLLDGQLKSTKQLLGRFGERFLLLGMLAYNKEGKLCLEDADGFVELDFSTLVSGMYQSQWN